MVGKRHYEVARMLKVNFNDFTFPRVAKRKYFFFFVKSQDIPTGSTFTLRLVEPMKSGFQGIGPRSGPKGSSKKGGYGSGKETLRFKANGNAAIEDEVLSTLFKFISTVVPIIYYEFSSTMNQHNWALTQSIRC